MKLTQGQTCSFCKKKKKFKKGGESNVFLAPPNLKWIRRFTHFPKHRWISTLMLIKKVVYLLPVIFLRVIMYKQCSCSQTLSAVLVLTYTSVSVWESTALCCANKPRPLHSHGCALQHARVSFSEPHPGS